MITFGKTKRTVVHNGLLWRHETSTPIRRDGKDIGAISACTAWNSREHMSQYACLFDDGVERGGYYTTLKLAKTKIKEILEGSC